MVRADARRFESWEHSRRQPARPRRGGRRGARLGRRRHRGTRASRSATSLRDQLATVPGLVLHDLGRRAVRDRHLHHRRRRPVHDSPRRCATGAINISVSTIDFARYDFEARGLDAVARASVHYYNTEDELDRFVAELRDIVVDHHSTT